MSVHVALMAMESRRELVDALLPRLAPLPVTVLWGNRSEGIWANARRAYLTDAGSHVLVLQDDAEVCSGFGAYVQALVQLVPGAPLTLFCHGPGVRECIRAGIPWARIVGRAWGVANLLPVPLAQDFVAFADRRGHSLVQPDNDDGRYQDWLKARGLATWAPLPCPVQHKRIPSTVGHPEVHLAYAAPGCYVPEHQNGLGYLEPDLTMCRTLYPEDTRNEQ